MRILSFTGGAGAMYCGSCLRDNALAAALLARGHDVVLTPVYTPTRTDERNVSRAQVFFGGISVFLEQQVPLFRHTPRVFDRLWDAPWVIRLATKRQIKVDPASLGEMTVSMLRGERGFQAKEIAKLLEWLRREPRFDVVNLPYALLIGLFLLTVVVGQLISNTATALVVTPIALAAGQQLGINVQPLLMTVTVAAAASFLTPVATPANLMVMEPAGYHFNDYWKLGLPMTLWFLIVAVTLIPLIWRF